MLIENIALAITIITTVSAGLFFIIQKVTSNTKHEVTQDNKIDRINHERENCLAEREAQSKSIIDRLMRLEERDSDRELLLVQVIEKIEHTQAMISQLTEHQQSTFKSLIEIIREIKIK